MWNERHHHPRQRPRLPTCRPRHRSAGFRLKNGARKCISTCSSFEPIEQSLEPFLWDHIHALSSNGGAVLVRLREEPCLSASHLLRYDVLSQRCCICRKEKGSKFASRLRYGNAKKEKVYRKVVKNGLSHESCRIPEHPAPSSNAQDTASRVSKYTHTRASLPLLASLSITLQRRSIVIIYLLALHEGISKARVAQRRGKHDHGNADAESGYA